MTRPEIVQFLTDLERAWPDAETELHYSTPFTLLIAVVLSAQATDASVNRVTPALFAAAPDPAAMVALGEDGVGELIRTIGLWRNKAKNVVELSRQLLAHHNGEVPGTREALEALAGVGRKTANVVLNVAFHQPPCRSIRMCSGWPTARGWGAARRWKPWRPRLNAASRKR